MNKKEVLEIRKQYTHEKCSISRICGCYVDGEKNIKTQIKEAFLSLPEEETFKYFNIFKQTLSGTLGKNLLNLEFPLDAENPGGPQEFLLKLRDSKLQDDVLLEEFYQKVIENYYFPEIITSSSSMWLTIFLENPPMARKCSMPPRMSMSTCSAASVRSSSQSRAFSTTRKPTILKTGFVTGLLTRRPRAFCSRPSTTVIPISIPCFIFPSRRKNCSRSS